MGEPKSPAADELTQGTTLTADALIENGLPYDGCSYPVTIAGVQYAPSPASQPLVEAFAGQKTGRIPAKVEYRVTGGSADVPCGWRSTRTLPELEVVAVTAN